MEVRGAPAIGCTAAYGLVLASNLDDEAFRVAAETMRAARPTAVNLAWAVDRMQACRDRCKEGGEDLRKLLLEEAHAIARDDEASCRSIGAHGAKLVPSGAGILTHCNAGALATFAYGTALGVIRAAFEKDPSIHVYVDETRPYLQGARLTAWELAKEGIRQTLITDNMAAHFMQLGKIQFIVTGADRIAANGDAANKIGTYGLAVLAAYHQIPFYVAAPLSTFDPDLCTGTAIPIEQRSSREVTEIQGVPIAPANVTAAHPAFDVTPHSLIQGLITEAGVLRPPYWRSIPEALEMAPKPSSPCDGLPDRR
jgi:methylthioribose-1-phosphate isomerase